MAGARADGFGGGFETDGATGAASFAVHVLSPSGLMALSFAHLLPLCQRCGSRRKMMRHRKIFRIIQTRAARRPMTGRDLAQDLETRCARSIATLPN
jgi:hypothetical protein